MINELRIGNWIFEGEEKPCCYQVEEIKNEKPFVGLCVVYRNGRIKTVEPTPIALTDEWLQKFGHEDKKGYYEHPDLKTEVGYVEFDGKREFFWIHGEGENILTVELEWVHKFQNLVHLIDGQELKLLS